MSHKNIQLTSGQVVKKNIWHVIYPVFPWVQNHFLKWHLIWHDKGRQPYHLGWIAPGKSLQELEKHLHDRWGFGNHFVAWTDRGQVLSWRKLVNFDYQYHIRVFSDGEIRGHYEYTPESKPVSHFAEIAEEERRTEFAKFLGDFVTEKKHAAHLKPDMRYTPESEITIDDVMRRGK